MNSSGEEANPFQLSQDSAYLLCGGNDGFDGRNYRPKNAIALTPEFSEEKPIVGLTMPAVAFSLSNVCAESIPGDFGFGLDLEEKEAYPKMFPYCYSGKHNMLIVKDNVNVPFIFCSSRDISHLSIRVVPIFTSPEFSDIPVKPCFNHMTSASGKDKEFISCTNSITEPISNYISTRFEVESCAVKHNFRYTQNLMFHCRTSCATKDRAIGLHSRNIDLIFQLEDSTRVLGKAFVSLKVSVSPGRDITNLRKSERRRSHSSCTPAANKRRRKENIINGTGKYSVVVTSKRSYRTLSLIACELDLGHQSSRSSTWSEYMEDMNPSQTSCFSQNSSSQPEHHSLHGFLARYGLGCYASTLSEGGFDTPDTFKKLAEKDLDKLNITDPCHRITLIHAAEKLELKSVECFLNEARPKLET